MNQLPKIGDKLTGSQLRSGMVIRINCAEQGGMISFPIERITEAWAAWDLSDLVRTVTIGQGDMVELLGHFNPESADA